MLKNIFLAFIPIFVAVDALGLLPFFISFTQGLNQKEKRRLILGSIFTAICLALVFILLGKAIFKFLGISIEDFMIAGGIILFCLTIDELINPEKKRRTSLRELSVVPLGTPLIMGPAVLTTSLMIIGEYGLVPTLISVVINIFLAGLILLSADFLIGIFGSSGVKVISKITGLLLAAIAVMMVRKGIERFLVRDIFRLI